MAGLIPKEFIDELVTRVDIVDVIDSRVPLKKAGREYKACCPFHEERTPSFTVSQDKQFYHCFGCGAHGTAIGFLMAYEHLDFPEAVERLAAHAGLQVPHEDTPQRGPGRAVDLLEVLNEASRFYRKQLREHPSAHLAVEYLKQRQMTGETAARFGIGYAPDQWDSLLKSLGGDDARRKALQIAGLITRGEKGKFYDRFRNRIMFPIQDHRGRVVGFGGRALGSGEPKYLNSPETPVFHKGAELYGLYAARGAIREAASALVVEGYMDVVMLAQSGIENVVATLGTATTRAHLERLFRHSADVIFCFDGDRAGRAAAWRALETALPVLRDGRQVSFLFLPEGQDPDSMVRAEGRDGFLQYLKKAQSLPEYLLSTLITQVDLQRLDGRARLIDLARPYLQRLEAGALKELLIDRLAELAQAHRAAVEQALVPRGTRQKPAADTRKKPVAAPDRPDLHSPEQIAISYVIQHPRLARIAHEVDEVVEFGAEGDLALLRQLVHTVTEHPGLNTAALLERFRGSDRFAELEKLAALNHMNTDEEDAEREFRRILGALQDRARAGQAERMLQSDRKPSELSDEEKARLRELLQRRP